MDMDARLHNAPVSPDIPEVEGVWPLSQRESFERKLREERQWEKLRKKGRAEPSRPDDDGSAHYEPQRLTRKICWQYDNKARRVPMLRRPYI